MDMIQDMLRESEAKVEREREKVDLMAEQNKAMEMMLEQVKNLGKEVARLKAENEQLSSALEKAENQAAQMKKERDEQKAEVAGLKMQLAELNKMANKVVEKTGHDELQRLLRTYMNKSKCKKQQKREYIKTVIMEMVQISGMTLPEDMQALLDSLDDEVEKKTPAPEHLEYVVNKYVENEIGNIEPGGIGVQKQPQVS